MVFLKKSLVFSLCASFLLFGKVELRGQCSTAINSFPYSEDFENGPGGWFSGGLSNDWDLGIPQKPTINTSGSGTQCWVSGGLTAAFYNYGERSWVQSPCFDFSNLNFPVISLKIFWELENQYDGGNLQFSIDNGTSWQTLGSATETDNCVNQNWYTIRNVTNLSGFTNTSSGWSGTIQPSSGSCRGGNGLGEWKDARHCASQLAGRPSVIFRMTMGSGTTCNDYDGIAFDLFQISESAPVPYTVSYACQGLNQVAFMDDHQNCHDQWLWNFGDPISPDNTSQSSAPVHLFSGPGIFSVSLSSGSACIPPSAATTLVEILSVNTVVFPVTCDQGNDGSAIAVVPNPPSVLSYSWNTIPVQTTEKASSLSSGNYIVSVSAPGACTLSTSVDVGYGPEAFPFVSLGADTVLCPGNPINIYPGSYASYVWQDATTDSVFIAYSGATVAVTIKNSLGCTGSDTILIEEDCLGDILLPNSFTPNNDGVNEIFSAIGNLVSSFEMNIFNRWGQLVFSSNSILSGWDGTMNGCAQQEGIYVCKLKYSIRNGEIKEKTGRLLLMR